MSSENEGLPVLILLLMFLAAQLLTCANVGRVADELREIRQIQQGKE